MSRLNVVEAIKSGIDCDGWSVIETEGCMKGVKGKVRYQVDGERPGWKIDWENTMTTSVTYGAIRKQDD